MFEPTHEMCILRTGFKPVFRENSMKRCYIEFDDYMKVFYDTESAAKLWLAENGWIWCNKTDPKNVWYAKEIKNV